jgi:hypothetical protein
VVTGTVQRSPRCAARRRITSSSRRRLDLGDQVEAHSVHADDKHLLPDRQILHGTHPGDVPTKPIIMRRLHRPVESDIGGRTQSALPPRYVAVVTGYAGSRDRASYMKLGLRNPSPLLPLSTEMDSVLVPAFSAFAGIVKV